MTSPKSTQPPPKQGPSVQQSAQESIARLDELRLRREVLRGSLVGIQEDIRREVVRASKRGLKPAEIGRALGVTRQGVYDILKRKEK
jgi:DNA-directed RNA polymerase specialized sigma24 family protein